MESSKRLSPLKIKKSPSRSFRQKSPSPTKKSPSRSQKSSPSVKNKKSPSPSLKTKYQSKYLDKQIPHEQVNTYVDSILGKIGLRDTESAMKWGTVYPERTRTGLLQQPIAKYLETVQDENIKDRILRSIANYENSLTTTALKGSPRIIRGVHAIYGLFEPITGRSYYLFGDLHIARKGCGSAVGGYNKFPYITTVVKNMMKTDDQFTDIFAEIMYKNKEFDSGQKYHWKYSTLMHGISVYRNVRNIFKKIYDLNHFLLNNIPWPTNEFDVQKGVKTHLRRLSLPTDFYTFLYKFPWSADGSNILQIEKMFEGCFRVDKSKCPKEFSQKARFHYADIRFIEDSKYLPVTFSTKFNPDALTTLSTYDFIPVHLIYEDYFIKFVLIMMSLFHPQPHDEFFDSMMKAQNFHKKLIFKLNLVKKEMSKVFSPEISTKIKSFLLSQLLKTVATGRNVTSVEEKDDVGSEIVYMVLNRAWFERLRTGSESYENLYNQALRLIRKTNWSTRFVNVAWMYAMPSEIGVIMMDMYTLARMFKSGLVFSSSQVFAFAGDYHAINYAKFLVEEMGACLFSKSEIFAPAFTFESLLQNELVFKDPINRTPTQSLCVHIPPLIW